MKWKNIVWEDGEGPGENFSEVVVKLTWNEEAGWYAGEYWLESKEDNKTSTGKKSAREIVRRLLSKDT